MADKEEPTISVTKAEFVEMATRGLDKRLDHAGYLGAAIALESLAQRIETADASADHPAARAGLEKGLRWSAAQARELAAMMREEATKLEEANDRP